MPGALGRSLPWPTSRETCFPLLGSVVVVQLLPSRRGPASHRPPHLCAPTTGSRSTQIRPSPLLSQCLFSTGQPPLLSGPCMRFHPSPRFSSRNFRPGTAQHWEDPDLHSIGKTPKALASLLLVWQVGGVGDSIFCLHVRASPPTRPWRQAPRLCSSFKVALAVLRPLFHMFKSWFIEFLENIQLGFSL